MKRLIRPLILSLALVVSSSIAGSAPLIVSSGEGILRLELDPDTGEWSERVTLSEEKVGWFDMDASGKFLYGTTTWAEADGPTNGGIAAFAFGEDGKSLERLNERFTEGKTPCYVHLHPAGGHVAVANFRFDERNSRGSVVLFPIEEDGSLGASAWREEYPGQGAVLPRQSASHPHSLRFSPDGRFFAVGDLGIDAVVIHSVDPDPLEIGDAVRIEVKPGQQPRHVAWHPSGAYLYCMNEAGKTVTAFRFDAGAGQAEVIQNIGRLSPDATGGSAGADLVMHPSGRFLYGSNRGVDTIVAYRIDEENGELELVGHAPTGGGSTRSLAVSPCGGFLVAANQGEGSLRLFRVDDSGALERVGEDLVIPAPRCVRFLKK